MTYTLSAMPEVVVADSQVKFVMSFPFEVEFPSMIAVLSLTFD